MAQRSALVVVPLDIQIQLPVEIASGLILRRPTQEEVEDVRRLLHELTARRGVSATLPYEADWVPERTLHGTRQTPVPRPPSNWRYRVIETGNDWQDIREFLLAANLSEPVISSLLQLSTDGGRVSGHWFQGEQLAEMDAISTRMEIETFDEAGLARLRSSCKALAQLNSGAHPGIRRAIELFDTLKALHIREARILWTFSILEMLLTHNPSEKEIGDSLNHQLSTKIPLISDRMTEALDYCEFPHDWPVHKVWKQLYAVRSCIAHGNSLTFGVGDFRWLPNAEFADRFLTRATRRLLRHALEEPRLFDSLKPI